MNFVAIDNERKIETLRGFIMKIPFVFVLIVLSLTATFGADGDLDTSFNGTGSRLSNVTTLIDVGEVILQQPDLKIVVVGRCNSRICVIRYNADGSLDTALGGDGIAETTILGFPTGGALQPDGKILAAAGNFIVRFNADGTLDTTFSGDGQAPATFGGTSAGFNTMMLQPDGKIVGVGTRSLAGPGDLRDIIMARFNTDGALDTTFDGDGILISNLSSPGVTEEANDAVLDHLGRIVICGWKAEGVGFANFLVARYSPDGSLDTSFSGDGWLTTDVAPNNNDIAQDITLTPIGRILVGGSQGGGEMLPPSPALLRYNYDGALDPSLDGDGILLPATGTGAFQDAVVQPDGKIVAQLLRGSTNSIVRLNHNGSFDTTFSLDGNVTFPGALKVALQSDGKILTTGTSSSPSATNSSIMTARLLNTPGPFTASTAAVSGRVIDERGGGIRNATVILTGGNLETPLFARTSSFGYFTFEGLDVGQTYVAAVSSKRYIFEPRIFTLNEDLADLDFVPYQEPLGLLENKK